MNKRKGFRLFTVLALCMVLVCSFSMTAFAYADDTDQNLPITDATQPEDMPETEPEDKPTPELPEGEPIDDEGNAYTRDLLYDKATNKQFITIQTKSGNTFYIVIDYDAPINDEEEQYQTYFLNMVDEAALKNALTLDKLEAMTCVCSVGLDMIAVPGDTSAETLSAIIADEAAIGVVNTKTTAVRIIPAVGKKVGEIIEFGGLLGSAPVMPVHEFSSADFIARGGRIPAPMHSLKN